jgi:hypothetical protein
MQAKGNESRGGESTTLLNRNVDTPSMKIFSTFSGQTSLVPSLSILRCLRLEAREVWAEEGDTFILWEEEAERGECEVRITAGIACCLEVRG